MSIKSVVVTLTTVILLLSGSCEDPAQPSGNKKAFGVFELYMDQVGNKVTFIGKLTDGPQPMAVWDTVMTSGECVLLKPGSDCGDGCELGYTCVKNKCLPDPKTIAAGTVTVTGYKNRDSATTSIVTETNGIYQATLGNRPANPPFTEGGTLTMSTSGNDSYAGFTLSAKTISKIKISADTIPMNPGEDIHLTWEAPKNTADSRMIVVVDIAYHASAGTKIVCDCADDGDLVIPGAMLDRLKELGMAGHPKLELSRRSIGTDPSTGVLLSIQSYVLLWLKIPGLISCTNNSDGTSTCPDGYTCVDQHCVEVK